MATATKDELRRERLREYDAALTAARAPLAVLALFARGREARAGGQLLEEAFAATEVAGVDAEDTLPAAVWVALRQDDVDAVLELLLRTSRVEFVLAAHEELDAGYRLTKVEERRPLPDLELLIGQLAAFLAVPRDVVSIISGWGADDPRTTAEIDTLLEQRYGPAATGRPRPPEPADRPVPQAAAGRPVLAERPGPAARPGAGLRMSSAEFGALLNLAPEQRAVLATLVRQAEITIDADG